MVLFKKLIELTIPNTCDLSTNDFSIHVLKLLNNTTLLTLADDHSYALRLACTYNYVCI